MSRHRAPVNLFGYLDYRKFLCDWFAAVKARNPRFSHRAFAKRAGFQSSGFLKLVMTAQRNLTSESLEKFVQGLQLNKQESEYFRHLVHLNQSVSHEEKDQHYQRLLRSQKLHQLKPIQRDQYEYFATWYHPVVRELVASPSWDGTPEWLAAQLAPAITAAEAQRSLELLAKLGFLVQDRTGRWQQADILVSTGAEVSSIAVMNYHYALLDLTKTVLSTVPAAQRDISALTLGITSTRLPELKRAIQQFRQEILKLVSNDTAPELVVQLGMQLFPVTKVHGETS